MVTLWLVKESGRLDNLNAQKKTGRMAMKQILKIKRIVTPIDFSDNSRLIADSAAFMAGKYEASLYLVFVVQNFEDYSGFFVPQMHVPNLEDELMSGAQERMLQFVEEHKKARGNRILKCKFFICIII